MSGTISEPTENRFRNLTSCTFNRCSSLSCSIPAGLFVNALNLKTFYGTFYGCSGLSGSIPAELFANTPNVTSFSSIFVRCSGLTSGSLDINTDVVGNMEMMFYNCSNLKTLVFGKNVKKLTGSNMFYGCNKLESIIMLYHVEEDSTTE